MKKSYLLKSFFIAVFAVCVNYTSEAQIRITQVDPATKIVRIHNYGSSTVNVSSYWFCHLFSYSQFSGGTLISGSLNLAAGADVEVEVSGTLNATASDLGIYSSSSFGSSTAMQDFVQWGSGGNGRENVAVAKGIWVAGDFVSVATPYAYTGTGTQNGVAFWATALGVDSFENSVNFSISPNPVKSELNIVLPSRSSVETTIRIYDILGKQVHNTELVNQQFANINVTSWNSGIYLVRVSNNENSIVKRFVKQ